MALLSAVASLRCRGVVAMVLVSLLVGTADANVPLARGDALAGLWPRALDGSAAGATPLRLAPTFRFEAPAPTPRLRRALERYRGIVFGQKSLWPREAPAPETLPLESVAVDCPNDAPPARDDDESYRLVLESPKGWINASTFAGCHRALEAFSQLTVSVGGSVVVNSSSVALTGRPPLFPYRGLMIDSGRHFLSVPEVLLVLDGMAASGLNVLHWHLTDSQSWPWRSKSHPELIQGAYRSDLTYSRADLDLLVAYADDRAIRVIPEIDLPGHAAAAGVGRPDVIVDCSPDDATPIYDGGYQSPSLLDPTKNETYALLDDLFGELASIFPGGAIHLGGDEVESRRGK